VHIVTYQLDTFHMEIIADLLCKLINYNIQYNVKYIRIVYYNTSIHIKYFFDTMYLQAQLSKM